MTQPSPESKKNLRRKVDTLEKKVSQLESRLEEETRSAEMLERLLKEAYDEMREAGLIEDALEFPVSHEAIDFFEALPQRFDSNALLDLPDRLGISHKEMETYMLALLGEGMIASSSDEPEAPGTLASGAGTSGDSSSEERTIYRKTGHAPYF